jgi:hypothetical protein
MGVNVIQTKAKEITNGISSPLYRRDLVAYITPPNPGKLPGPAAYVWVTSGTNKRQTAKRGAGFRNTSWIVSVWLMSPDNANNPNADSAFASLIDAVVNAWVTTPMPVTVTDAFTGQQSQLVAIGEQFTIQQSPAHVLADQRLYLYEALLEFTIEEMSIP